MSDTRPVWLTREQRDYLADLAKELQADNERMGSGGAWGGIGHLLASVAAWDAAPADATGKVIAWFDAQFDLDDEDEDLAASVKSLLRALGMPDLGADPV